MSQWKRKTCNAQYRTTDAYRSEDALDPLRNPPDFKILMIDLAFPADPPHSMRLRRGESRPVAS